MLSSRKLFNNKLNLVIITILLFLIFILYNILSPYPAYYNIEGFSLTNCFPDSSNALPPSCTGYSNIPLQPGTCAETYGPLSTNNNPDLLRRCVDQPFPSSSTPATGVHKEVSSTFCTNAHKTEMSYKNYMSYYGCEQLNPDFK